MIHSLRGDSSCKMTLKVFIKPYETRNTRCYQVCDSDDIMFCATKESQDVNPTNYDKTC